MQTSEILSRLDGVRQTGEGRWMALCPAHSDRRASLSISTGDDGRTLIRCHAGCETGSILDALNLKPGDLFASNGNGRGGFGYGCTPSGADRPLAWDSVIGGSGRSTGSSTNGSGRSTSTSSSNGKARGYSTAKAALSALERKHGKRSRLWKYFDRNGEPVGLVVRWDKPEGKDVRPISRIGDRWQVKAMPAPRPLYGINDLPPDGPIHVVEGELCVDAARSSGLAAIASSGGSSAADKTDWTPLRGREVILTPDSDQAGEKYIADVAAILRPIAATIKVLRLPGLKRDSGDDLVDWLDRGGDADRLRELVAQAEEYEPGLSSHNSLSSQADDDQVDRIPLPSAPRWPTLDQAAYHGLIGDVVRTIEPETEADPVAILAQFATMFGNLVGRGPHYVVEGTAHYPNLYAVLVGSTSKGRKGTSEGRVRSLFTEVDEDWLRNRTATGLVSGEGLIWQVRDPIYKVENIKEKGRVVATQEVLADAGEPDKRLMVIKSEFASVLRVCRRETNTLSPILRSAWDTGHLRTLSKNSPAHATDAHVSIVGHITEEELRRSLAEVDGFNGFANRFLWLAVRRSKLLPDGGREINLLPLVAEIGQAAQDARGIGRLSRSNDAGRYWRDVYADLSGGGPGLLGAVTSRAEAQVLRLSMVYALADCSSTIEIEHLRAAHAVWRYVEETARRIFNTATGDPLADKVLDIIRETPGLGRRELHRATSNHIKAEVLVEILARLSRDGYVERREISTGGRPAERWFAKGTGCEQSEQSELSTPSTPASGPDSGLSSHNSLSSQADQRQFEEIRI